MEEYLQKLVIILPATAIAMGGLLLVVFVYSRSRSEGSASTVPVPQRSVTTQADEFQQMSSDMTSDSLHNLVEEAMERVKLVLSEEFRNKQATKISLEEFNNLFSKQRGLDEPGPDVDDKQVVEPGTLRIPLPCTAPKLQDSSESSLNKSHSFASLWVEELQKSGFGGDSDIPSTQERECEFKQLEEEPALEVLPIPPPPSPPQHAIVTVLSSDCSSVTELDHQPKSRDCISPQLGLNEAATYLNEAKAPSEVKLMHDLESFLLTASLNLCRSVTAFPRAQSSGGETTLNSNAELNSMVPDGEYVEQAFSSVASTLSTSTSTSMDVPQVLKGGAPTNAGCDFEWRLDIDEASSPSNHTPVGRRPRSHLCRGVRFVYEDHPPALSLIDLNPEMGYGWRGPDWKETYGKYHMYKEHKGPGKYRKPKLNSASDPGKLAYYKSVRADSKKRWEAIKSRTWSKARAFGNAELPAGIRASAGWRNYLKTSYPDSSSTESDLPPRITKRVAGKQLSGTTKRSGGVGTQCWQDDQTSRITSMLTSSSSSSLESDESSERTRQQNKCKTVHQHCPALLAPDHQESSGSSSGGGAIE